MNASSDDIIFERRGRAGLITLNRPRAMNALTLDMVRRMHRQLGEWLEDDAVAVVIIKAAAGSRAFSAGGDIRALYEWGRAGDETFRDFYREEYRLNAFIKAYPKPYIALIDGIAMGGGVGVSVNGSHRVAGDSFIFAMPETGIGLFPDVGGSYFLSRCPGESGVYLGLTGARIGPGDGLWAGIATHYVNSRRLDELETALCEGAGDVDAVLDEYSSLAPVATMPPLAGDIDRHFAHDAVEAIIASLASDGGEWAEKTLATLKTKSPTSLKITLHQLRLGKTRDFNACMRMEFRIVSRIFHGHDFFEGIRAVVIDKDNRPKWRPHTLEEVSEGDIYRYFSPLDDELEV